MAWLAIETATAACSAALIDGELIVAERHEVVGRGHAERLVPMISELLAEAALVPDAILVDCGPGSFTGVRVGVAAARALAFGWGVPVAGVSSLVLIAARGFADRPELTTIAIALTGGHGELFVQSFVRPLAQTGPLRSLAPEDAAAFAPEPLVLGSGAALLVAARGTGEAIEAFPRAADMRLLPPDLPRLPPSPIYGRAPDARPQAEPAA